MDAPLILELHAIVHGRVQGVGFRWSVVQEATQLGLVGIVKNLDDGSVEINAQGPRPLLNKLLVNLKSHSGVAEIDNIDLEFADPVESYKDFIIVR